MGCFGSREDSRRKAFDDDWTGTDYAFITPKGKADVGAFCPVDKIVLQWVTDKKELKDKFELPLTEEKAKELVKDIWDAMKALHKDLKAKEKDEKEGEVYGKYSGKDAAAQMEAVMAAFATNSEVGLKWPEEEAPAAMMEGMEAMAKAEGDDAAMMEGGAEGADAEKKEEGMAMDAMMAKMSLIALDAFGETKGFAEIPKCLLSLMFSYPVFGDAVKAATMAHDLGGDSSKYNFAGVAALVGAYVDAGEKAEAESFGAAWLNDDDFAALKESSEGEKLLVFPGIVGGWSDKTDALGQACKAEGKTQVLFKFKGKVLKPAGEKLHVFCRQFAKIESLEGPQGDDKFHTCVLADYVDVAYADIKEYVDALAKVGAGAAAAAETAMEVADKKEDDKKDDMMAAGGEGMEAPM